MTKFEKGDLVICTDLRWQGMTGVIVNASTTSNWYEVRFFNENDAFNFDDSEQTTKHRLILHADRLKKLPSFKVGNMVTIHDGAYLKRGDDDVPWRADMKEYVGTYATIVAINRTNGGFPYFKLAGNPWYWDVRICEPSGIGVRYEYNDVVSIVSHPYKKGVVAGYASCRKPTPFAVGFSDNSVEWFNGNELQDAPVGKGHIVGSMKIDREDNIITARTDFGDYVAHAVCSKDDDFDFRFGSQLALNRMIDKMHPNQAHFFGFETALLYIKSGAKVRRAKWAAGIYINAKIIEQNEIYVTTEDMFATDWRVMEDFEL